MSSSQSSDEFIHSPLLNSPNQQESNILTQTTLSTRPSRSAFIQSNSGALNKVSSSNNHAINGNQQQFLTSVSPERNQFTNTASLLINQPHSSINLDPREQFNRRQSSDDNDDHIAALGAVNSANEVQRQKDLAHDPRRGLFRMLERMLPERGKIAIGLLALMVASLCSLVIPLMVGKLVDLVQLPDTKLGDVKGILLITLVVLTINAIANFTNMSLLWVTGDKIVAQMRVDLFKALIYREIGFFDSQRSGELLSRLSTDVGSLNNALTVDIAELFQRIAIISGALIYMFYISWDLSIIALLVAPIIGFSGHKLARKFHGMAKEANAGLAEATIIADETLSNIRTVRTLSLEFSQQQRYNEQIARTYRLHRQQKMMKAAQRTYVYYLGGLSVVGTLWYGAKKVLDKDLTSGELLSFLLMALSVGANSGQALDNWTLLSIASGACEKVLDLVRQSVSNIELYHQFKSLTPYHSNINDTNFDKYVEQLAQRDVERSGEPLSSSPVVYNTRPDVLAAYDDLLLCTNPHNLPRLERVDLRQPIRFNDVWFAYPSRPSAVVLRGVDFTIQPGEKIGLCGSSGGGKSSCIATLLRLYPLLKGSITIGDTNINDMNEIVFRSNIGYVEQKPNLFNQSVLNNILTSVNQFQLHDCSHSIGKIKQLIKQRGYNPYTSSSPQSDPIHSQNDPSSLLALQPSPSFSSLNPESSSFEEITCPCKYRDDIPLCQDLYGQQYTLQDVKRAAALANIHETIMGFPLGYHTMVGDRAMMLSGGQAQRVCIARNYMVDSSLIILDEATSALDGESEKLILESLEKLSMNRSTISVAHRLSSLINCDRIFFFGKGKVLESGSHEELLKLNGHYAKLWSLQFAQSQLEQAL